VNAEQAAQLLAHALPPEARKDLWQRKFTPAHRSALAQLDVTDAQAERLERILPAIAYYAARGPSLAAARTPLVKLAADAHKAAAALRALLDAPEYEEARGEARLRMLEALAELHPERCKIDPQRVSFFHRYDEREDEARRLLGALTDVEAAADHACKRMPTEQTRAVAHHYPVALIDAALSVDGPAFRVSASAGSKFRDVATLCFEATGHGEPLRAIRAYLSECNASPKK